MTQSLTVGDKVHFNPSNRVGEIVKIHGPYAWVFTPQNHGEAKRYLYADLREAG